MDDSGGEQPRRKTADAPAAEAEQLRRHFAEALSAALRACHLPLSRVQARLAAAGTPVSVATLSYWQSGRSLPSRKNSLRAIENLEDITGVAPGSLSRLLWSRHDRPWRLIDNLEHPSQAARALDAMRIQFAQHVSVVSLRAELRLPAKHRCPVQTVLAQSMRVEADVVVDRMPLVLATGGSNCPALTGSVGYTVGQEYRDNQIGMTVYELLLPRPFTRGEVITSESTIDWGPWRPGENNFEWGLTTRAERFVLKVVFAGSPPSSARSYSRPASMRPSERLMGTELPVRAGQVELNMSNTAPGLYGIEWRD